MVLEFQEIVSLTEDLQVTFCRLLRLLVKSFFQISRNFTGQAGAQRDDPFVILPHDLLINPRFVVEAVHKAFGDDLHQVLVTGIVFREKDQMVIPVLTVNGLPVKSRSGGDVHLAADDRFDPRRAGRTVKIDHTVHDTVIGDRHAVHAEFLRPGRQLSDFTGSVQKTVLCMDVQVCKCHLSPPFLSHLSEKDRRPERRQSRCLNISLYGHASSCPPFRRTRSTDVIRIPVYSKKRLCKQACNTLFTVNRCMS